MAEQERAGDGAGSAWLGTRRSSSDGSDDGGVVRIKRGLGLGSTARFGGRDSNEERNGAGDEIGEHDSDWALWRCWQQRKWHR